MKIIGFLGKGVKKLFHFLGETIRAVINTVLGGVTYLLGVGPVSIIGRLVGKEFLEMKLEPQTKSYWKETSTPKDKAGYYRQF